MYRPQEAILRLEWQILQHGLGIFRLEAASLNVCLSQWMVRGRVMDGWVAAEIRLRVLVLSRPIYDHVSVKHFTLIPLCEPTEISIQGGCFHDPLLKGYHT